MNDNPKKSARVPRAVLALAVLLVALPAIAWWLNLGKNIMKVSHTLEACPHTVDWATATYLTPNGPQVPTVVGPNGTAAVPGIIQDIPEFHDCQRFLVDDGAGGVEFGGRYSIYASYHLADLDSVVINDGTQFVRSDAGTTVPATPAPSLPGGWQVLSMTVNFAGAEIWAPDEGYGHLNIEPGFNCLFLNGSTGAWTAWMLNIGDESQVNCDKPTDLLSSGAHQLPIHVFADLGKDDQPFLADDYPAVARWDWDPDARTHFIRIRCGAAECIVGAPKTFAPGQPRTDLPPLAGMPNVQRRVYQIPLWYDDQILAKNAPAVPSGVRGTLIPDSLLGSYTEADFKNQWVKVGEVVLPTLLQDYKDAASLTNTAPHALNAVYLCHADGGVCPGAENRVCTPPDDDTNAKADWRAKVVPAMWGPMSGSMGLIPPKYLCVYRREAPKDVYVPPTARWRFKQITQIDEQAWFRCVQGCCEVEWPPS